MQLSGAKYGQRAPPAPVHLRASHFYEPGSPHAPTRKDSEGSQSRGLLATGQCTGHYCSGWAPRVCGTKWSKAGAGGQSRASAHPRPLLISVLRTPMNRGVLTLPIEKPVRGVKAEAGWIPVNAPVITAAGGLPGFAERSGAKQGPGVKAEPARAPGPCSSPCFALQ